jgi:nucleosome binding factor SPN SPT16 subunit
LKLILNLKISGISNVDNLIFTRGNFNESEEANQNKTSLLHTYLLGYEFTDTMICFTNEKVIFFLFKKKSKNFLKIFLYFLIKFINI